MIVVAAKVARYFTVAAYGLACFWFAFGTAQASDTGGFFAAVVAVAMLLRVMDRWNNLVAAAEYGLPLGSGVARFMSVIVCALIDGTIAYGLYNLSQWVGDVSPWWYAARFFMAHVMFSAGATLFAAACDLDPAEGGKMRKSLR